MRTCLFARAPNGLIINVKDDTDFFHQADLLRIVAGQGGIDGRDRAWSAMRACETRIHVWKDAQNIFSSDAPSRLSLGDRRRGAHLERCRREKTCGKIKVEVEVIFFPDQARLSQD